MKANFTIVHFNLSFIGLAVALMALPFSIKVCHAGIILFLLMWALEGNWTDKLKIIRGSLLLQIILGLFVLNVLSLLYTQSLYNGWLMIEKKIFFLLLPIALATSKQQFTSHHVNKLFYLFVFTCLAGSFISIWNSWNAMDQQLVTTNYLTNTNFSILGQELSRSWLLFSYISLADGIDIHPTFFSLYIAFCVVLLFTELLKDHLTGSQRFYIWTLIIYFLAFLVCLSSRIVIGALLIVALCYIIYELRNAQKKRNAITVALLIPFICALLYLNPVSRYRSIEEVAYTSFSVTPNTEYKTSIQIRLSLWLLALKSIDLNNFLTGTGTADVKTIMEESGKKYAISNVLDSYDPHNQFLFNLLGHGVIGLLLLILNFIAPVYYTWKMRDYQYLIFAFLFFSLCLTESAFELQKGIVFYAIINALLLLKLDAFKTFLPSVKVVH